MLVAAASGDTPGSPSTDVHCHILCHRWCLRSNILPGKHDGVPRNIKILSISNMGHWIALTTSVPFCRWRTHWPASGKADWPHHATTAQGGGRGGLREIQGRDWSGFLPKGRHCCAPRCSSPEADSEEVTAALEAATVARKGWVRLVEVGGAFWDGKGIASLSRRCLILLKK